MRILIIRHGDPNYVNDTLTEKGWKEALCLAEKLAGDKLDYIYVSPLGRAKDTASVTLKMLGKEAVEYEWLREFAPKIKRPDLSEGQRKVAWDWLPQDWTAVDDFYTYDKWQEVECLEEAGVRAEYEWVTASFDELIAEHGYCREGRYYRAEKPNHDTLVFFCHFGLECVLLSRLLNVSPMILWHGLCAAPTSVTTVVTEERREGIASFRVRSFGDTSHLYAKGEAPSNSALFCECYTDADQRHD